MTENSAHAATLKGTERYCKPQIEFEVASGILVPNQIVRFLFQMKSIWQLHQTDIESDFGCDSLVMHNEPPLSWTIDQEIRFRSFSLGYRQLIAPKSKIRYSLVAESAKSLNLSPVYEKAIGNAVLWAESYEKSIGILIRQIGSRFTEWNTSDAFDKYTNAFYFHNDEDKQDLLMVNSVNDIAKFETIHRSCTHFKIIRNLQFIIENNNKSELLDAFANATLE